MYFATQACLSACLVSATPAVVPVPAVTMARTFAKMEGGAGICFLEERNNVDIFCNQNIIIFIKVSTHLILFFIGKLLLIINFGASF
jgi:hypothetical protein